jgi:hypothetical protein
MRLRFELVAALRGLCAYFSVVWHSRFFFLACRLVSACLGAGVSAFWDVGNFSLLSDEKWLHGSEMKGECFRIPRRIAMFFLA